MTVANPREVPEYELNPLELQIRRSDGISKACPFPVFFFFHFIICYTSHKLRIASYSRTSIKVLKITHQIMGICLKYQNDSQTCLVSKFGGSLKMGFNSVFWVICGILTEGRFCQSDASNWYGCR